jgi:hypothetical protein
MKPLPLSNVNIVLFETPAVTLLSESRQQFLAAKTAVFFDNL